MTSTSSTLDSLPKQFVIAMRTLFDIMDDKQTGFVNFVDIVSSNSPKLAEARWQDDDSKGLPKGVLESLRKVTPPNGMLSFERFCAGLKICLLRNQVERRPDASQGKVPDKTPHVTNRPPSAPLLDLVDNSQAPKHSWGANNTAAIRPNNVIPQQNVQRTLSMPQLKDPATQNGQGFEKLPTMPGKPPLYGPPKPPRTAIGMERSNGNCGGNIDRAEIRTALANWQMGLLTNQDQTTKESKRIPNGSTQQGYTGLLRPSRSLGDGKAAVPLEAPLQGPLPIQGIYQKKPNAKRREPRRHTLQNGIDYNMLKKMKQIEQEKEVLMTGLSAVEKARDWYLKQVAGVQEKMKYLGRMGHLETWSEAQQERLELQRARVLEVNRHLAALTESWERGGLPLHMNLAVHHYPPPQDLTDRLKQQNRMLNEEISKKSDKIAALEREKASLIQVLQIRSQPARSNGNEEVVF
ncbi:suppressor APC domain-containing protein 2 isoform X1 [Dendroctonus ponderosae]|uniref:Suppressor APC domain-containing protein n=1 Tax=Dendroctonus ponderosae TaxID=77166 RepID=A0AAR5Q210_DENPD|nr:suppressor APC domain-containing protein 2 isoform X1 [Dendroctonus ponderosae]